MASLTAARLRPTRTTLIALAGLIRTVASGAIREFIWADLRAGLLDLRGLSNAARGLVVTGFALLFLMVAALLFNDFWREQFPLVPMTIGTPGRGSMLPYALLPVTMFLLAIAFAFALAGAIHSHWAIRIGVLLLYLFTAITWNGMGRISGSAQQEMLSAVGLAGIAAVLLLFALRWRARPRPAVEFTLLLLFVSLTLVLAHARSVESWRWSGVPIAVATLNANVISMGMLVVPLLLMLGVNIADFTRRAAGWVADIGEAHLPAWLLFAGLGLLVASRLRDVGAEVARRAAGSSFQAELVQYAGALAIPAGIWLVWWLVARERRGSTDPLTADDIGEAGAGFAPKLIVAYTGFSIVTVLLYNIILALLTVLGLAQSSQAAPMIQAVAQISGQGTNWQSVLELLSLLAVVPLARRGHHGLALFLGTFGVRGIWLWLTAPGRPLGALAWQGPEPVTFWWVITFAAFGVVWLARRELTAERAGRLIFLLLMTFLLGQTDFISNPFSPFFSFAGIGFIAFGIVWDSVTIGYWANRETPGLPRTSRIFLYLGYVLLTVALINWVLTAHDLKELNRLTGATALHGLNLFGKPLLYAIYVATLMLPARTEAGTATGDED